MDVVRGQNSATLGDTKILAVVLASGKSTVAAGQAANRRGVFLSAANVEPKR